jgi:cell division protein FtsA
MFWFLRKFRPKTSADAASVLVLDIGTEFVKALSYKVEERHGFVTGYAKVRQKLGDMSAGSVTDIAGVAANCATAITQVSKQSGTNPEQTVMGIAGELVRGRTAQVTYTREAPETRITMDELNEIVHRVQRKAFTSAREELSRQTGHVEVDVKLVHAAIVDARIDSARVENPVGFQGKEVSLSVFNAFAPLVHFGALQTIAAELDLDLLTIAAEPYAVVRSLMSERASDISAITIDVGGGTTDIGLVRGGHEMAMRMFAIGGRMFTKRISQAFNISFTEAERIKIDYSSNQLDARTANNVKKALSPDVEVWLAGVELALSEVANDKNLPHKIYLCGGGSRLPELKAALESADWIRNLPFAKAPHISFLVPDDIPTMTDQTGLMRSVQDVTPLALANLGLELAGEESVTGGILRKAVKMLNS